MKTVIELTDQIKKHSNIELSEVMTNEDGVKYQFKNYTLKYKHTAYWLSKLFHKAQKEVGEDGFRKSFTFDNTSITFDRSIYKGQKDGKLYMKELIMLK
jgi:anaerobic ribonucleoside-triphosphate reductase